MKNFYFPFLVIVILSIGNNLVAQSYFKPAGDFTSAMNINILEAKVNGVDLGAGDEIGIFDGSVCVGSVVLTKNLQALGDLHIAPAKAGADDADTSEKDGYKDGNVISFKLYDTSEEEEIPLVTATFVSSSDLSVITPSPSFDPDITGFVSLIGIHNYTPKAKAGADQQLNENSPGQLDGSASSDYDGSPLTYLWDDIDNLGLTVTNVVNPTFTAPKVNSDTQYRVALIVNDGEKDSKPDTVIVTVKQVNLPPVANAGADFEVPEGDSGSLDGSSSSDPDGLGFTFSWVIEPAEITLDDANIAKPSFTAPIVSNDKEYLAILTVTNDLLLSDKDTVKIKVVNFNLKPVANAGSDVEKNEGENVTLDGSGSSDPDTAPNPALTFSWTSVEGIALNNATTDSPDFDTPFFLKDSLLHFVLVVNDGGADSEPDTVVVKVKHKNLPPTANAGADFDADENMLVQLDASTSFDLDGTLNYLWTSEGITINGSGLVNPTFTAPEVQADSIVSFYLLVTDDQLETDKDTVKVTIKHINKKPVANAGVNQEVDENVAITLDGSGSFDPDMNDNITYKWLAPAGITLDDVTAVKPSFTSPSIIEEYINYTFKLVVNDGKVDSDTSSVVIKVIHLNIAPMADAGTDIIVDENTSSNLDGSASSDPEGKALSYLWTAPAGFAIDNPTSATTTFTAPEVEKDTIYIVALTVNDGVRSSDPDTVKVTVNQVNKQPVANAGADKDVDENVLVQLDGTASYDIDKYDAITYLWTSLNGAVLDDNTSATPSFTTPWLLKDSVFVFKLVVNDGMANSAEDLVSITVIHANLQPVADAGTDIIVDENTSSSLDGSASSDPEGKALSYLWTAPAGFAIDNPTSATTTFTAPEVEKDTIYTVVLTVNDGVRSSNPDTVKVTVNQVNKQPVANAGADQTVDENVLVQLDGTASYDVDMYDAITYLWTSLNGAVLDDNTSATPSFTTPWLLKDSVFVFKLVVNDGMANSVEDLVSITVIHANLQPTADAGTDIIVDENTSSNLDGSASSDPEGKTLSYLWTAPAGFAIDNPTSATTTFTAPEVEKDTIYIVALTVNDGVRSSDPDTVKVTVNQVNKQPVANAGADKDVDENVVVHLDGTASYDVDMYDAITYLWTSLNGAVLDDNTSATPSFTTPWLLKDSVFVFKLVVNDGMANSAEDLVSITVIHANLQPVADAGTDIMVDENTSSNLDGSASSDPEGKALSYLWTASAGFAIDNPTSATTTFTAPEVEKDTIYIVVLTVNDGVRSSNPDTVKVAVNQVNKPPVANAGADKSVDENVLVQLDGTASYDIDKYDAITYLWTSLNGAVLDDNTSATPSFTTPWLLKDSVFVFKLVVNDGMANSAEDLVSITVIHANLQPTADAGTDKTVDENTSSNLDGSASSDPEGMTLSYLWTVPAGFVIDNPTSATTTFTAPEVDVDTDFEIILKVDDGESMLNTASDTIIVTVVQVNKTPVANAGADFSVREQKAVTLDGSASNDPDALDEIIFNWVAPAGVVLDDATAEKPTFISADVDVETKLVFELTVTDKSLATDKDTIEITVTPNRAPIADAGADQKMRATETVTLHGENSSDPDGDVLTFAWTAPAEITLQNPTSPNPTFIAPFNENEKSFSFTLEVTDDLGLKSTSEIIVTVVSNTPPVIVTKLVVDVVEGKTIMLDASKSYDPDGDGLSFKWSTYFVNQEDLVSISNRFGETTMVTVPEVEEFTVIKLSLKVTDGLERTYAVIELHISKNQAPVADAGGNITVNEGENFILNGGASKDPENDEISFSWNVGDITTDDATLEVITCTAPEVAKDTVFPVVLVVNDGKLASAPDTVWVTVINVNKKPVANAGADIIVNEGEMFTLDGSASNDPDNDKLTFNWSSTGITLPSNDFVSISITAPEVEENITVQVVLEVNDGQLNSAPDTVFVKILQVNKNPEWTQIPADSAFVGHEYSAAIIVSDPDMMDSITIFSEDLPDWLILIDNGDGTAELKTDSVPRDENLIGTHIFVIKATDGNATIETTITLTITIKTGLSDDVLLSAVKFYPNPTTGLVNVEFNSFPEIGTTIQVFNQLGQIVQTKQANSQINQLNLSNNPVGLYYIKVASKKDSRVEKIILK